MVKWTHFNSGRADEFWLCALALGVRLYVQRQDEKRSGKCYRGDIHHGVSSRRGTLVVPTIQASTLEEAKKSIIQLWIDTQGPLKLLTRLADSPLNWIALERYTWLGTIGSSQFRLSDSARKPHKYVGKKYWLTRKEANESTWRSWSNTVDELLCMGEAMDIIDEIVKTEQPLAFLSAKI